MPRLRKCIICGQEFLSKNGRYTCSDICQLERKKQQDKAGNERRYRHESNTKWTKTCPVCGEVFETIRSTYCSEACYQKAKKEKMKENWNFGYNYRKERK